MKTILPVASLVLLGGCLTAHMPSVSDWNVVSVVSDRKTSAQASTFGIARLAQLVVCAPYDQRPIQVYRSDNTLVDDPYNLFAATPSRLLREPARTTLDASGRFKAVVGPSSAATASHIIELTVTDFRLDCSKVDEANLRREAVAEVFVMVLDDDRNIAGSARGVSRADAGDGNYGTAFSTAFSMAILDALAHL